MTEDEQKRLDRIRLHQSADRYDVNFLMHQLDIRDVKILAMKEDNKRILKLLGVPFCAAHDYQHCAECDLTEKERKELMGNGDL